MELTDEQINAVTIFQWGKGSGGYPLSAHRAYARAIEAEVHKQYRIEDTPNTVAVSVEADEVLVAIKRPEGYEDVHPELVAEDILPCATFEYRVVWPVEVAT